MEKQLSSILIKPAGPDCNLACDYCFYLQKCDLFGKKTHRMSDDTLRTMVRQAMRSGSPNISFGWQGGEPTLMGLPFFERAVEYQIRFGREGQVVGNGLQTNGIVIDKSWAAFLRDAQFLVGLSLDGPQHVHDKYRKFAGGKSSWERVAKSRDVLLNNGVEVNALIVINDYSAQFAREIYEYHKANGIKHMQWIPAVEPDPLDPTRAAEFSVSGEAFGRFLIELFDLWVADFRHGQPSTFIRWFDSVFYTHVGMQAPECTLLETCGIYVVVEHNGDVYSCDFFVDPEWKLGNIATDNLVDMLNSPLQEKFGAVKHHRPSECADCKWLWHCYGGCPKDRQGDPRDNGSNHFCESYKMFFEHADAKFRQMAKEWKRQQAAPQQPTAAPQQVPEPAVTPAAETPAIDTRNIGRNDPCPCGSGKKFKKCCG